jgi:hypothetical protein
MQDFFGSFGDKRNESKKNMFKSIHHLIKLSYTNPDNQRHKVTENFLIYQILQ